MSSELPTPQSPQDEKLSSANSNQSSGTVSIASDSDTLEADWAHRANTVLSQYAHNPKELSNSFAELKAQYIYARTGKQLPVQGKKA